VIANSAPRKGDVYLKLNGIDNYVEIPSIDDYSIATTGELVNSPSRLGSGRMPSIFRGGKEPAMCTGSERARGAGDSVGLILA
jgi:hypothetical protein